MRVLFVMFECFYCMGAQLNFFRCGYHVLSPRLSYNVYFFKTIASLLCLSNVSNISTERMFLARWLQRAKSQYLHHKHSFAGLLFLKPWHLRLLEEVLFISRSRGNICFTRRFEELKKGSKILCSC